MTRGGRHANVRFGTRTGPASEGRTADISQTPARRTCRYEDLYPEDHCPWCEAEDDKFDLNGDD